METEETERMTPAHKIRIKGTHLSRCAKDKNEAHFPF